MIAISQTASKNPLSYDRYLLTGIKFQIYLTKISKILVVNYFLSSSLEMVSME